MRIGKIKDFKFIDYVWLIYFNIIYSFVFSLPNMQMMSTILLAVVCVAVLCWRHGYLDFKYITTQDCTFWFGLFFIYTSLSYFWSSAAGRASSNIMTTLVQILVFFLCIDWYVQSEREIDILIRCFCTAAFVFAVVAFATSPVSTYNTLDFGGITGQHRNTIGYILMYGCLFQIYYGNKLKKKWYYFEAFFCFFVSLLTGSRKIIFGYLVAIFLWIIFQDKLKKVFDYMIMIIIAMAIMIPLAYQIPYIRETFGERLLAVLDDSIEDGSVLARERAKELAVVLFKQSPIIGKGWNAVVSNYAAYWDRANSIYAHNNYLEVAADFGIIGVVLYYWIFVKKLWWSLKNVKTNRECRFLVICLVVTLLLDYGQVIYWYLYPMIVYAILFKMTDMEKQKLQEAKEKGHES